MLKDFHGNLNTDYCIVSATFYLCFTKLFTCYRKVTEKEISDFFKTCGKATSVEIPLGEDGRSSGTAYVKFTQRSELEAALELDGQYWPGTERWLKILEGIEKPERKSFGASEKPEGCDTVFVGNLAWEVILISITHFINHSIAIAYIMNNTYI